MTSEIVENKESPRQRSLQSHKNKYVLVLPNSVLKPFHPENGIGFFPQIILRSLDTKKLKN